MYLFLDLQHQEIKNTEQIDKVFDISEDLSKKEFIFIGDNFNLLKEELKEENYYVIHSYIVTKGKKRILKGKIVISDKFSILSYLSNVIEENNIRPLKIIPKESMGNMIYMNDEGCFYIY